MFPFFAHKLANTQKSPSFRKRKAPNINIEVTEIKTHKSNRCYTTGAENASNPYFSPTKNPFGKLQASHYIKIKTINQTILKFSKKSGAIYLFRIGIIKIADLNSFCKNLGVLI
jgi:hypothetical protein